MSSLIFVRVFSPQHGQRINSPLSVYLLLHGNRKSRQRRDRHGTIELASHTRPTIHLIGGTMNRYGLNVQGSRSTTEVLGCRYNICFLGVTGFNPSSGFCCENEEDCLLKQAVIRQSDTIVVLMDSKKYGQYNTYSICQCDVVRYGPC